MEEGEEQEFEVEDILRYRRNQEGEEYFLVKWVGFPSTEATWEPLGHMNDNCRELVAKARALFAWRRPPAAASAEEGTTDAGAEEVAEVEDAEEASAAPEPPRKAPSKPPSAAPPSSRPKPTSAVTDDITIDDVESPVEGDTNGNSTGHKRAGDAVAGAAPPKRPKPGTDGVAPAKRGAANGTLPAPTPRSGEAANKPAPVELKCICGANEKLPPNAKGPFIVCKVCNCCLHPHCVEGALNGKAPPDFVCPPCRLERVDEFHPPVGAGLLRHNYAASSSTFSLSFTAQATQWRKQQWAVHLRAVHLGNTDLGGPAWPHQVQGKLNGRQCVAIDPPKHLHVRREQCYNLTPLLRQGVNTLELRFSLKPDAPRSEAEEGYCVGVVLTRPRSVASIIARIKTRSTETVNSGKQRVKRLLEVQAATRAGQEDECKVTGNFGRTLKPLCPVSLCPIEEAAIGRSCQHIQVFDLQSYIAVNQRMRSLDKRWTCPVCSLPLRPDDVITDPYAQGILDTLRGEEDTVEAVVFEEDCTWSTISAIKDEKERPPTAEGKEDEAGADKEGAELIDLSDSE